MNTLEIRDMELTLLSPAEQVSVNGGLDPLLTPLIIGLIVSFFNDFGDIRKGLVDGYNGTPLKSVANEECCQ